jgi:hypothetical protein
LHVDKKIIIFVYIQFYTCWIKQYKARLIWFYTTSSITHSISCIFITETYYWFGDNDYVEFADLFDQYKAPPYKLPNMHGVYSFGLAGTFFIYGHAHNLCNFLVKRHYTVNNFSKSYYFIV